MTDPTKSPAQPVSEEERWSKLKEMMQKPSFKAKAEDAKIELLTEENTFLRSRLYQKEEECRRYREALEKIRDGKRHTMNYKGAEVMCGYSYTSDEAGDIAEQTLSQPKP